MSCPTWAGHHAQLPASWKTGVWRTGAIALTPSLCLPAHQAHMPPTRKGMQPSWLRGDTVHPKRTARCCVSALCWR